MNAQGHRTRYEYDSAGRQVAVVNALGQRSETVYDAGGRAAASVDALGRETSFVHDALGRVWQTLLPAQTAGAATTSVSTAYNDLGQRVAATDQLAQTREFAYDPAGALSGVTLPAAADLAQEDAPGRRVPSLRELGGESWGRGPRACAQYRPVAASSVGMGRRARSPRQGTRQG